MSPFGVGEGKIIVPQGYIFFKFLFLFEMLPDLTTCKNCTIAWVCDSAEDQFCNVGEEHFLQIRKLFGSVADPTQDFLSDLEMLVVLALSFQCFCAWIWIKYIV